MSETNTAAQVRTSGGVMLGRREAIVAEGPDTVSFLQGQLSQDVEAMAPGDVAFSLLLHPQGKISAWLRVTRTDHERYVLDVDAGWADEVLNRLSRFKLRTKCDLSIAPWTSVTLFGPGSVSVGGTEEHRVHGAWGTMAVTDIFGPDLTIDVAELDASTVTALRIEAGLPAMGSELDESTIPAAAGVVDQSVSFTKGCYTGQELVARIDSRGNNVPRRLVGIVFGDAAAPAAGAEISLASSGDAVGAVTSSAAGETSSNGAAVAMAYVSRKAEVGDAVVVTHDGQQLQGSLRSLPLVS